MGNNSEEKGACLKILKNRDSAIEPQVLQKDSINFLAKQHINSNIKHHDSPANKGHVRDNCRNFEELNKSCDNDTPLEQDNENNSKKHENFIITGDSMFNNIDTVIAHAGTNNLTNNINHRCVMFRCINTLKCMKPW